MPYTVKGKCIFKKDTGKKVGCTKGSVDKYLAALHANVDESSLNENLNYVDMFNKDFFLVRIPFLSDYKFFDRKNGIEAQRVIFHENVDKLYNGGAIILIYVLSQPFYWLIIAKFLGPKIYNLQFCASERPCCRTFPSP
jgi:hypothetical protein